MAASDATYRNTRTLNIVFAASSVVMLLTIIGMFAEDYFRDWKIEQRLLYDIAVQQHEEGTASEEAQSLKKRLDDLLQKLDAKTQEVEKNQNDYNEGAKTAGIPALEAEIADLEKAQKAKIADFDRFIKVA